MLLNLRLFKFKFKKTLIIPQGTILLWTWQACKIIIIIYFCLAVRLSDSMTL